MQIEILNRTLEFQPWDPSQGCVFDKAFAFDCETTLIDEKHPEVIPTYILGAACDGSRGVFILPKYLAEFFEAHRDTPFMLHNAPFDLAVIQRHFQQVSADVDIYGWFGNNLVWDTQLMHRLLVLGREGHTARGKGESTLEHCARHYLGLELPKDLRDSAGDVVRLSYGKWLNSPPAEIESIYLEYAAKDVLATYLLGKRLSAELRALRTNAHKAFGYVSDAWYREQRRPWRQWGPQTHHIQLRGAIVLHAITQNGLHIDQSRVKALRGENLAQRQEQLGILKRFGYVPGETGVNQVLQNLMRDFAITHADLTFPKTPQGDYETTQKVLEPLRTREPFVAAYLEYKELEKLESTYLSKMDKPILHPSFNPLVETGRTSSFGAINAQNLPRDARLRSSIVPRPGHLFVTADYSTVELATLSQAVIGQLNTSSRMADAINREVDLHCLVASQVTGEPPDRIAKETRQKTKAINFGKPGGMGTKGLQSYAKESYGLELSLDEVEAIERAWFALFPEMKQFLENDIDTGKQFAELIGLSSAAYDEHMSRHAGYREFASGAETSPGWLGGMCLKVLKEAEPKTKAGKPYTAEQVDYFWDQVIAKIDLFPDCVRDDIRNRKPSDELHREARNLAGRSSVITLTGRLRANASYCQRRNTLFQGLAADGAKLALWLVWREGYRIVNFIHDEFVVEIPDDGEAEQHRERIKQLMIEGMKMVVPDVRIGVESVISDRWSKEHPAPSAPIKLAA